MDSRDDRLKGRRIDVEHLKKLTTEQLTQIFKQLPDKDSVVVNTSVVLFTQMTDTPVNIPDSITGYLFTRGDAGWHLEGEVIYDKRE